MQYHQTAVVPRESILRTEAEWLRSVKADLVVLLLLCCAIIQSMSKLIPLGHGCNV